MVRIAWNLGWGGTKKVPGTRYSTQWKTPQKWTVLNRTMQWKSAIRGTGALNQFIHHRIRYTAVMLILSLSDCQTHAAYDMIWYACEFWFSNCKSVLLKSQTVSDRSVWFGKELKRTSSKERVVCEPDTTLGCLYSMGLWIISNNVVNNIQFIAQTDWFTS